MVYEDDILVEITDTDLEELANMYKSHKAELPHLHSFLQNCLKAKKIGMSDFVTVFSPRNCWREDGTFIASMPTHGHDIVLHSLDPSGNNLIEGLIKTQRFKFLEDPARNYTLFYAVHELFYSKIEETLTKVLKHELILANEVLDMWHVEKEQAIYSDMIDSRDDVYVKELTPEDVSILNSVWPYRYPDSEKKILDWLKLSKGFGVYLKSNNQLVSWVISSCLAQMGALQTLEEHKKKGYGSLAVMKMSEYTAEKGFDPCGTVHLTNVASQALFGKLHFKKIFKCDYIGVHNKY